jgi:hypothetical protein
MPTHDDKKDGEDEPLDPRKEPLVLPPDAYGPSHIVLFTQFLEECPGALDLFWGCMPHPLVDDDRIGGEEGSGDSDD